MKILFLALSLLAYPTFAVDKYEYAELTFNIWHYPSAEVEDYEGEARFWTQDTGWIIGVGQHEISGLKALEQGIRELCEKLDWNPCPVFNVEMLQLLGEDGWKLVSHDHTRRTGLDSETFTLIRNIE